MLTERYGVIPFVSQGTVEYECSAMAAIENNLDWCHPPFTHPGTHPYFDHVREQGFREYDYEARITERGLVVFAPATASPTDPIPEQTFAVLEFALPEAVTVRFGSPEASSLVHMHFVPTGPSSCRVEWLYAAPSGDPGGTYWTDAEPEILAQDRRILESAEPWYAAGRGAFERSVEADVSTLLARKVVALVAKGERPTDTLPARRLVRVRA